MRDRSRPLGYLAENPEFSISCSCSTSPTGPAVAAPAAWP